MKTIVLVSKTPRVTLANLEQIARAVSIQIRAQVAPAWGRIPWEVIAAPSPAKGAVVISVVDDDTSTPDALGWHTEDADGTVFGEILVSPVLDNGGTMTSGPDSVSGVISHECIETFLDAAVSTWDQAADGNLYAHEGCDAVEGDAYGVGGVSVSNFVLPAFFDSQRAKGPYDHLGLLTAPFTMTPGGYQAIMVGGAVSQIFGEKMPAWKRVMKARSPRQSARHARAAKTAFGHPVSVDAYDSAVEAGKLLVGATDMLCAANLVLRRLLENAGK